jgi:hypothetical protein
MKRPATVRQRAIWLWVPALGILIAVWIWRRCLSHVSWWRIDMFRLRRCFLVGTTDRCLLRIGLLGWRIFGFVLHIQFPPFSPNWIAALFVPVAPVKRPATVR